MSSSVILLSFLTGSAGLCLPRMCSYAVEKRISEDLGKVIRRGKTDPEALLVYFVRVKAVQRYITPKPTASSEEYY